MEWSLYGPNGTPRQIHQNFLDAKKGDLVVGYESSPVKQVVALGRIAAPSDGWYLWVQKTEQLAEPVDLAELRNVPRLEGMQAFRASNRGSLFKLTEKEYGEVIDLVRDQNPLRRGGS